MNTPSIKRLGEVFGDNATEAKRILAMPQTGGKLTEYASVEDLRARCYHKQSVRTIKLTALNELSDSHHLLHGIEACETVSGEYAEYLNTGDMYAATLIYWRGRYRVQDLGTFIETQERRGIRFK